MFRRRPTRDFIYRQLINYHPLLLITDQREKNKTGIVEKPLVVTSHSSTYLCFGRNMMQSFKMFHNLLKNEKKFYAFIISLFQSMFIFVAKNINKERQCDIIQSPNFKELRSRDVNIIIITAIIYNIFHINYSSRTSLCNYMDLFLLVIIIILDIFLYFSYFMNEISHIYFTRLQRRIKNSLKEEIIKTERRKMWFFLLYSVQDNIFSYIFFLIRTVFLLIWSIGHEYFWQT